MTARRRRRDGLHLLEALEGRQLLAWGNYPLLMDQDLAVQKFPQYNGAGATIAALDSGVSFKHPALSGRIWTNPYEIAGNGIDDDKSGKIDDIRGWDFIGNDNDVYDDQGHGTMVAGVMVGNHFINTGNTRGYAGDGKEYRGIAWGAKVIPLRVANSTSYVDINRVQAGLQWIITNHKRFNIVAVNMSLGFSPDKYEVVKDELATLWNAGVFIAASSGNGGNTNDWLSYPAAGPYTMSVGAVNDNNTVTSVTSRGPSLDILAPGNRIIYLSRGTDYEIGGAGTSYAAPFIAAAGAIIKQIKPSFTPNEVVSILRDSGANVYDSASGLTFKRLDLDNAIALAISRAGISPPASPTSQTPFSNAPIGLPGTIEAEEFDFGGEGVAFHDLTSGNDGGAYRTTGVDIQRTGDAGWGYHVSHARGGEWLEYTVNVAAAGTYDVSFRVASYAEGGKFHLEVDGKNVTGSMSVPRTGGWDRFTTVTRTGVSLPAGQHVLRLYMESNGPGGAVGNLNWIKFSGSSASPAVNTRPATNLIQAENYSAQSGIVRNSTNLSYVDGGDWARYDDLDFGSGVSLFTIRIATADAYAGKTIELRLDGVNGPVIGKLTVNGTGGWSIYKDQTAAVSGVTGVHDLYLTFVGGGGVGNIDWFRFA